MLRAVAEYAREQMRDYDSAHDFQHVLRVYTIALSIADQLVSTGATVDAQLVQLSALLHDVYDHKIRGDVEDADTRLAKLMLESGITSETAHRVAFIATHISYSKQKKKPLPDEQRFLEFDIVQDADRLDAMGAVGIARVFAYGGHKQRSLADCRLHFDDKLLRLEETIRTTPAKHMARQRHVAMTSFVAQFDRELEPAQGPVH